MAKIKYSDLNYKRNVNVWTKGNPESSPPHVLQTVGISKPVFATVASYVGMTHTVANSTILADGFVPQQRGAATGTVSAQSPVAGLDAALGSSIWYDVV